MFQNVLDKLLIHVLLDEAFNKVVDKLEGKMVDKMVGKMVGKVLDKMEAPSKVRGSGLLGGWTGKCPAPASLITGVTKHPMSKSA